MSDQDDNFENELGDMLGQLGGGVESSYQQGQMSRVIRRRNVKRVSRSVALVAVLAVSVAFAWSDSWATSDVQTPGLNANLDITDDQHEETIPSLSALPIGVDQSGLQESIGEYLKVQGIERAQVTKSPRSGITFTMLGATKAPLDRMSSDFETLFANYDFINVSIDGGQVGGFSWAVQ